MVLSLDVEFSLKILKYFVHPLIILFLVVSRKIENRASIFQVVNCLDGVGGGHSGVFELVSGGVSRVIFLFGLVCRGVYCMPFMSEMVSDGV